MNKTDFENLIRLLHEIKVSIDELVYKSRDTN